jgi:hypothetical protein
MTPSYVRSLLKVTYYMNQNNITWNFMTEYSSHVADARERTLGGSAFNDKNQQKPGNGEWTYDKLFWIDSDIEWEPDDFFFSSRSHAPAWECRPAAPAARHPTRRWSVGTCSHAGA